MKRNNFNLVIDPTGDTGGEGTSGLNQGVEENSSVYDKFSPKVKLDFKIIHHFRAKTQSSQS